MFDHCLLVLPIYLLLMCHLFISENNLRQSKLEKETILLKQTNKQTGNWG